MRSLIIFITAAIILSIYTCGFAKRNFNLPDSCVYYNPVYDTVAFTNFDKETVELDQWDKNRIPQILSALDSLKILNSKSDTVFVVQFDRLDCKPFFYLKTRKGTVLERFSRCVPASYQLSPDIIRQAYHFDRNPSRRFGHEIIENPDSVLLSIIYQWDLDAVADFFRYGMVADHSIDGYRCILRQNEIVDIQRFSGLNNLYGRIRVGADVYLIW